MHAAPPILALPCVLAGAARTAALSEMEATLDSDWTRTEKDAALARLGTADPSLFLELVTGSESTWVGDSPSRPSYLLQALERDWPLTVAVALDAGIRTDQAGEFGDRPLISLRGSNVAELPSNKLPSLAMLTVALDRGYPVGSTILRPSAGRFDVDPDRSLLYEYTVALQMATASRGEDVILEMVGSVRALIEAGANEFDPITGPGNQGSNFAALVSSARYLTESTSDKLFEATVDLVRLAHSKGASIDRRASGDDVGSVLASTLLSSKARMAVALIEMGCDQDCSVVKHSFDSPMTLSELATWKVGTDGCASVLAAVMRRQIAMASINTTPTPADGRARRRMTV